MRNWKHLLAALTLAGASTTALASEAPAESAGVAQQYGSTTHQDASPQPQAPAAPSASEPADRAHDTASEQGTATAG